KAYDSWLIPAFWKTWYFQPGRKQGYAVVVSGEGKVIGRDDILEEDDPGENLDQSAARQVAEKSLAKEYKADLAGFKLVSSVNEWPTLFRGYRTEISIQTFYGQVFLGWFVRLAENFIGPVVLVGALLCLHRSCYPGRQLWPARKTDLRRVALLGISCAFIKL